MGAVVTRKPKFPTGFITATGAEGVELTGLPFCLHDKPVNMIVSRKKKHLPSVCWTKDELFFFVRPGLELLDAETLFYNLPLEGILD